jgi:hypothetical protein
MPQINRPFRVAVLTSLACGLLIFHPAASARKPAGKPDPLRRYLSCKFDDGLQIKEITRRSAGDNFRTVETGEGTKKVSVMDGYRVMFAYPRTPYFFANMKVEQSDPQQYAGDKETVIAELKNVPSMKGLAAPMEYLDRQDFNGYEGYGVERTVIDKGGVLGTYELFSDADHVIITVYFLNQGREKRRFESKEEFRVLRDKFLNQYTKCVSAPPAGG